LIVELLTVVVSDEVHSLVELRRSKWQQSPAQVAQVVVVDKACHTAYKTCGYTRSANAGAVSWRRIRNKNLADSL
jgi:hypothetical protein